MSTEQDAARTHGFSETYWNLHRNSLIFSLAWTAASLPGICLSETQTWALVTGHFGQPLLQFALACVATYGFLAFFLEWRREALSQFRLEIGRSSGLPDQIERLISDIGSEINSADRARAEAAKSLQSLEESIQLFAGVDVSEGEQLQRLTQEAQKKIVDTIATELPVAERYQKRNPLSLRELLNHAQVGPALNSRLAEFATRLSQSAKFRSPENKQHFEDALAKMNVVVEREERIGNELRAFQKRWEGLKRALRRENTFATARTWLLGIGAPTILLLVAICHGLGAWGVQWLPIPPISQLIGQPEKCPAH